MKVTIVEYSPAWPELFEREKRLLGSVVGQDVGVIEHVGSTSVVGLAAKPIIDIMVGLYDFSLADALVPGVVGLGYKYVPEYEDVMPFRRYFKRGTGGGATHHVHMVAKGGEFWERHLLFRDYLRAHPEVAAEYAALKKGLAAREWNDRSEYTDAKTAFIKDVEEKARG